MKGISLDVLKDAANRLMFDMSEQEYQTLLVEFKSLVQQMESLAKIEGLENIEPMTFPFECSTDYLREDVAEEPLPRDEALGNAGSISDGQIKLPKVVL